MISNAELFHSSFNFLRFRHYTSAELRNAQEQIRRLSGLEQEMQNLEAAWQQKFDKLHKEKEALEGSAGQAAVAAKWRER